MRSEGNGARLFNSIDSFHGGVETMGIPINQHQSTEYGTKFKNGKRDGLTSERSAARCSLAQKLGSMPETTHGWAI